MVSVRGEKIMEFMLLIALLIFICLVLLSYLLPKRDTIVIDELKEQLRIAKGINDGFIIQITNLQQAYDKVLSQKKSSEVKVGQTVEQLVGFLDSFPYPDDEIKALYQPVDLIVFRDSEIVFVEIKSGDSQLSPKQKKIKQLVQDKKVRFETHRVNGKGYEIK